MDEGKAQICLCISEQVRSTILGPSKCQSGICDETRSVDTILELDLSYSLAILM
jgi:hypothetical protein